MGVSFSLFLIPVVNRLVKLNREIKGRWFQYLFCLIQLLRRRKHTKTNRIVKHNVWKDSIQDGGILPFPHEWTYDTPSQVCQQSSHLVRIFEQQFKIKSILIRRGVVCYVSTVITFSNNCYNCFHNFVIISFECQLSDKKIL